MNLIKLKRMIRSNKHIRKVADQVYLILTGQYAEKKHLISKKGETYYVIRPPYSANGLGRLYLYVLGQIRYARSKGYLPVIDFERYKTVYSGGRYSGSANVWEWYFEQPDGVSLEKAFSGNYILARRILRHKYNPFVGFSENTVLLEQYFTIGGVSSLPSMWKNIFEKQGKSYFRMGRKSLGCFIEGRTMFN